MSGADKAPSQTKVVQLRPPQAEELAEWFEGCAQGAREGSIIGFNGLLLHPNKKYTSSGLNGENAPNAFEQIGQLVVMMLATWRATYADGE